MMRVDINSLQKLEISLSKFFQRTKSIFITYNVMQLWTKSTNCTQSYMMRVLLAAILSSSHGNPSLFAVRYTASIVL